MNALKLKEKGVELSYQDAHFTSWLELRIVIPKEPLVKEDEERQA